MKLQYLIQGLCLLEAVQAQTAKDDFDAVCDSQHEKDFTLDSGEKFTYVCRMTAKGGPNIIDTLDQVETSSACANACAAVAECKGSTWDYSFMSCVLYKDAEDLKSRNKAIFLRRVESSAADCTKCEKARTDLEAKLEACEVERDLLEAQATDAQKCESEKSQIGELTQELEKCKSDSLANALDLHDCQESAASGALELQHCKNNGAISSLELQQCQNTASSSALELQQCKSSAASTSLELQKCKATASSSGLPTFKDCNTGGDGQVLKIGNRNFKQRCNALMWKNQMPLRRVVRPGLNRLECAMICALDAGCQSVYYVRSTATVGECQLQNANIEPQLGRGSDIAYISV